MTVLRDDAFEAVLGEIEADPANLELTARGWRPLFTGSRSSRVVIMSQAPGRIAQESGIPFNDASGQRLTRWLGVDHAQLIDPRLFAIVPMDFYYPGKAPSGDLPPRRGIAERWHPRILDLIADAPLTVLVGSYAQRHVLGSDRRATLTETVQDWRAFAPARIPIVHPSPLNTGWLVRNPWFESELVPDLQARVADALALPASTRPEA
ncbi:MULTISPECIES: uracil-DNA glycosylase family protein [unclassified Leifsonia]|uniref:uracil-DNA glycosylase family protein n=1 Tax=unclassified Leifsonia TaxID=2663824 RepID=UPI0006F2B7A1|nr:MULTISPECIES: uracil-DNA glycosylase family protein [unclassified Leifsonia]KQX07372.1 uracil-DNA glycosylase [Leifsonia sp. Root1293]KRA11654.1 uracil-DNA glycosylase [Leifsonia sp. Root60]